MFNVRKFKIKHVLALVHSHIMTFKHFDCYLSRTRDIDIDNLGKHPSRWPLLYENNVKLPNREKKEKKYEWNELLIK